MFHVKPLNDIVNLQFIPVKVCTLNVCGAIIIKLSALILAVLFLDTNVYGLFTQILRVHNIA